MKKNNISQRAFSLIELLITIFIIGVLASMTFAAVRNFQPGLELRGAARDLISDLRYIQQITITKQIEYCIQFYPSERKYQLIECDAETLVKEVILSDEIESLTVNDFTGNKVKYNPYGAVSEAGSIILENSLGDTKTILVRPSGFVKISD